jgi:thiamine-phosphate pyrophosphorylase
MRLYAVTDRAWLHGQTLYEQVEAALRGGVTCVQLREKELDAEAFLKEALELRDLCRSYNVPFIVNDAVDIAVQAGADGVHVGQSDMAAKDVRAIVGPDMMIGVSAKTVEQALTAQNAGADYLGIGALFSTSTKHDASTITFDAARDICAAVEIPVTGIGGITPENLPTLAGLGLDGVALVSAIFAAPDIEQRCRELRQNWMFS